MTVTAPATTNWSELDKTKLYTIGTVVYTGLTVLLHPITVIKTRQQVLESVQRSGSGSGRGLSSHQPTTKSVIRGIINDSSSSASYKGFYRGLPVVISIAVPARVVYISVLESSKEFFCSVLSNKTLNSVGNTVGTQLNNTQLITSLSSGAAGGLAAIMTQCLIVPMDVISQRQMVAERRIGVLSILRDTIRSQGFFGLYRGFGLSLLSSIPGGATWWAVYGGMQHAIFEISHSKSQSKSDYLLHSNLPLITTSTIQLVSGFSAAVCSAIVTQPLDVVKVRLQVEQKGSSKSLVTVEEITRHLFSKAGITGFYRGLTPRIAHLTLWGSILSGAYEYLKHISRIDRI